MMTYPDQNTCPYCHHYNGIRKHVNSSRYDNYKNWIEVSPASLDIFKNYEFVTSFRINFCPICGRQITSEFIK